MQSKLGNFQSVIRAPPCETGLREKWPAAPLWNVHARHSTFLRERSSARKISSRLVATVVTFTANEIFLPLSFSAGTCYGSGSNLRSARWWLLSFFANISPTEETFQLIDKVTAAGPSFPLFRPRHLPASDGLSFKLTRVGDLSPRSYVAFDILQASSTRAYRNSEHRALFRPRRVLTPLRLWKTGTCMCTYFRERGWNISRI